MMTSRIPACTLALLTSAWGLSAVTACGDSDSGTESSIDNGGSGGADAGAGGDVNTAGSQGEAGAKGGSDAVGGADSSGGSASGGSASGGSGAGGSGAGGSGAGGSGDGGSGDGGAADDNAGAGGDSAAGAEGGDGGNTNVAGEQNGGAGGDTNAGGDMNAGGDGAGGDTNAGGDENGGDGGMGSDDPPAACEVIGWATRDGRTGGEVAVTGGGDATPIVVNSFGDLQMYAQDGQPRVIHVDGTVGGGWSGRTGDRLEVGSNKTIVGLRPGTELKAPIHVNNSTNVIIRNLVIRGPGSNSDQAWDNINIEGSSKHVWVDHCEFWDGQDGNADVVKGADNVTFTWNIFGYRTGGDHNFSNLVASSDDEPESVGKLNITLMFNWFSGVAQRQPRCRFGNIHVVNNLFTRDGQASDYGISAGKDCKVLTEANHFIDISTPIYTSHASGSAANELRGGNIFQNTSGNTTGYGTAFEPPYDYDAQLVPADQVKGLVEASVGATLESPADCD